jgi:rhodanese-related sulfurtransferase
VLRAWLRRRQQQRGQPAAARAPVSALAAAPGAVPPGAVCLDVRPPSLVATGLPAGALVLGEEDARKLAELLPPDVYVLAETDARAAAVAAGLVVAGARGAHATVGGVAAWVAAGVPVAEPAWKSPLPTGHLVRDRGGELGWVQDVRWENDEFRFDVLWVRDGALVRERGRVEEDLVSVGPRGAAGLGQVG